MNVYTNYYGAGRDSGIGTRAQSPEIRDANLKKTLEELSALHALSAPDKENEALMYLLHKGGVSVLGLSYTEAPSSSGYNRAAPCGIQYLTRTSEIDFGGIGRTVNFVAFRKPESPQPAVLDTFPVSESGYMFHNNPDALAAVVDALVKVALSDDSKIALIALPQTKNSEYTVARYTISEALCLIPKQLREKISFFTGLPAGEDSSDIQSAYENALKNGANAVFCSFDCLKRLKGRNTFIEVDMERPAKAGAFAGLVASSGDPGTFLAKVEQALGGKTGYEELNFAAGKVARGDIVTVDMLKAQLKQEREKYAQLESKNEALIRQCDGAQAELEEAKKKISRLKGRSKSDGDVKKILLFSAIALIVGGLLGWLLTSALSSPAKDKNVSANFEPTPTESMEPTPTASIEPTSTANVEPMSTASTEPTLTDEPSPTPSIDGSIPSEKRTFVILTDLSEEQADKLLDTTGYAAEYRRLQLEGEEPYDLQAEIEKASGEHPESTIILLLNADKVYNNAESENVEKFCYREAEDGITDETGEKAFESFDDIARLLGIEKESAGD